MRGSRARVVNIRHVALPGNFLRGFRNLSSGVPGKNLIRLGSIVNMRGGLSEIKTQRRPALSTRRSAVTKIVCRRRTKSGRKTISPSAGSLFEFFLFYLTGKTIFDNRHGLLKKLGSARTAETQLAVKPRN